MKKNSWVLASGLLLTIGILIFSCAKPKAHYPFPIQQMQMPPGGLSSEQVPLFVSFGTDDNPYSGLEASGGGGGMHYLTELFASRRNPEGTGDLRNFDGQPLHYSFYVNTKYITPEGMEDPSLVKQSWREAYDHGHEIAVHTHSHPHGRDFSVSQWEGEMKKCIDLLIQPDGLGVPKDQVIGFRTPFLEYGKHTLSAVQRTGFVYDCSVEEGFQNDADGRNYIWPYTLNHGSPGNDATYERLDLPHVGEHPGLWELPVYAFIVPPDELCESYGVAPGFRARMKQQNDYFELDQGKVTGMDWNLWFEYGMDKAEFLGTLKHTLDLRLQGNRCPLNVGLHSAIYADRNSESPPKTTVEERRDALREFLDYALSKPEVRVVSAKELLGWLQSPAPLPVPQTSPASTSVPQTSPASDSHLGAGFRFSVYGPRLDPGPDYWVRVGKEMASKFPGATPEGIWIIGRKTDRGIELPFPVSKDIGDPLITGRNEPDTKEAALDLFDKLGFRIWLQVEPRFASVDKLLHLVLKKYGHHSSIVGVGLDVEWYKSTDPDAGEPVSDDEARAWLAIARSYNPKFRLFLKHWLTEKMPPTVREGLLFVNDSQVLPSLDAMVDEFAVWGKHFAPAPVAFQIGYPSDRPWWIQLKDPPKEIGTRILKAVPNTEGLFWVDFSVLEVFPPDPKPSRPIVGIKIYDHKGDVRQLFDTFAELGINTVFASETLAADAGFREQARAHHISIFVIEPIFYDPEALKATPSLYAITRTGERAKEDWVEFVCPSRDEYRKRKIEAVRQAVVRLQPDGVSLDFIRFFVYWEMVRPDRTYASLPNTCFCQNCLRKFSADTGIAFPTEARTTPRKAADWIEANNYYLERWAKWKNGVITSMADELVRAVKQARPGILVNLHAVPWRKNDFNGAIKKVAGQDFAALSRFTDFLSPMCYTLMLHRDAPWIHSVVEDMAAVSSAPILPSIQVRAAYPGDLVMSTTDFEKAVQAALATPSRGVVFWSWDHLAQEPEKMAVLKRILQH